MKSLIISAIAVFAVTSAFAVEFLPLPGSQKGQIVFVNRQEKLAASEIEAVCREVTKATKCKAVVGEASAGQVVIEVINNPDAPVLAAYPEDYKATVNIGKLDKNLKGAAIEKFYVSRCRKELLRAFCYACGAGGSQYPDNIMAIGSLADLDLVDEFIPGDTAYSCVSRIIKIGVTPTKLVPYVRACREGWAPAPTNDAQKAIWDKVHAMPTEPLKIKPETKKQEK